MTNNCHSARQDPKIISCNQYVLNGVSEWLSYWQDNNWQRCNSETIKNRDLWERLRAASEGKTIECIFQSKHRLDEASTEVHRAAKKLSADNNFTSMR